MRFKAEDTVYIVINNMRVVPGKVKRAAGGFYIIVFDNHKSIRLKEHRIYATEEEARNTLPNRELKRNGQFL